MRRLIPSAALTAMALVSGCTVGPNYAGPPPVAPAAVNAPGFARAGDVTTSAAPAVADWWRALGDATLDTLITSALAANPDLAQAEAQVRKARAALRLQNANRYPSGSATAAYIHAHFPGLALGQSSGSGSDGGSSSNSTTDLDLYNAGFDASWEADLFGAQRRAIEAARASAGAAEAQLADAQVSLSAEVANAYINLRDVQQRIAANQRSIAMQEQVVALTQQRFGQGTASRLDVLRLQNQLESTRADLVPLSAQRDAYLDALAVLTGEAPGALDAALSPIAPVPLPPAQVAVGDPAALLQRRPDIRTAERQLAANTAKVGQAIAARFPKVSFMGILGLGGTSLADITKIGDFTALLAPQLSWSFLDFGRSKARVNEAKADRDAAEAKYRSVVLGALRDANDALSRFRYQRDTLATLVRAKAQADKAEGLSEQRYRAGTTTLIDVLDARRQQIAADQAVTQAEATLTIDFVAVEKALGLGWR